MNKNILAFLLAAIMIVSLLPAAALAAALDGAVSYRYIGYDGTDYSLSNVRDDNTQALFVFGGGEYTLSPGDANLFLLVGNDTKVVSSSEVSDFMIASGGSLVVTGLYTVRPGSVVESFTGSTDSVADIQAFVESGVWDDAISSYEITGNCEIDGGFDVWDVQVDAPAVLTLALGDHSYGRLIVHHTLTVQSDASLVGEAAEDGSAAVLEIQANTDSSVSGLALYDEDSAALSDPFTDAQTDGTFEFKWTKFNTEEGEICAWALGSGEEPGGLQNNQYSVEYDDRGGQAPVKVEETPVSPWAAQEFAANETLSFTLLPPDEQKDDTPVVEIEIMDGHENDGGAWVDNTILSSDGETPAISLSGNTFSYTPTSDTPFIVRVWWSADDYAFDHVNGILSSSTTLKG